jgi:uncharacterized protein
VLVGLISDTHGLLRPEALRALEATALILHAGDVGGTSLLITLGDIAPVRAVAGNVDIDPSLPASLDFDIDGTQIHVSHGHELGSPTPERLAARYQADVIVYGHTHKALVRAIGTTVVVNPGAAGPRRFNVKPSVGILRLPEREVTIVEL